jgi:hypothetical protein
MEQLLAADKSAHMEWGELMKYHYPKGQTQNFTLMEVIKKL